MATVVMMESDDESSLVDHDDCGDVIYLTAADSDDDASVTTAVPAAAAAVAVEVIDLTVETATTAVVAADLEAKVETRVRRWTDYIASQSATMQPCVQIQPHQLDGLRWCLRHELAGKKRVSWGKSGGGGGGGDDNDDRVGFGCGGIIADEMGLGKTIMLISLMVANGLRRTLVVVPRALIAQWCAEIRRILAPMLGGGDGEGRVPEKGAAGGLVEFYGENKRMISDHALQAARIVVTSYSTIAGRRYGARLTALQWSRIVFDEAHHLRHQKTLRFGTCAALQSSIHWCVTGTPVHGVPRDWINLYRMIGFVKTKRVKREDQGSLAWVLNGQFLLRRTKEEIGLALPPVRRHVLQVPFSSREEEQTACHLHLAREPMLANDATVEAVEANVAAVEARPHAREVQAFIASERGWHTYIRNAKRPIQMFTMLRQYCSLPSLAMSAALPPPPPEGTASAAMAASLNGIDGGYGGVQPDGFRHASKLYAVTNQLLQNKGNGCGKLVFCTYTDEIAFLANLLIHRAGWAGNAVAIYSGENDDRNVLTSGAEVLLVQIQMGCDGLNLQDRYSEVYFTSPHCNPMVEEQAIARCHRIGQTRPVDVYLFYMTFQPMYPVKSLDQHVDNLQTRKRKMITSWWNSSKKAIMSAAPSSEMEKEKACDVVNDDVIIIE